MADSLDIILEDHALLVLNKPPGVLTQAPAGIDSLESRARRYLIEAYSKPGGCYLGVPHRLDRPSSGVLIFGKNVRATSRICDQLATRAVDKRYWALVENGPEEDSGTWIDYMRKIPNRPVAEIVPPINPNAREAILHFAVLDRLETAQGRICRLEIRLETGRMHQIRLQAASRGFPLLGDAMYGSHRPFGEQFEDGRLRAIALHARSIALQHPMTREPLFVEAAATDDWKKIMADLS